MRVRHAPGHGRAACKQATTYHGPGERRKARENNAQVELWDLAGSAANIISRSGVGWART